MSIARDVRAHEAAHDHAERAHPVRVLAVIKGLGLGGAEKLVLQQAQLLNRSRVELEVAYLVSNRDHLVAALEAEGVPVHDLRAGPIWDLGWTRRLHRLLRNDRFDVVHLHSPSVAGMTRPLLRSFPASSRPWTMYTEHNRWGQYALATRFLNWLTYPLDDHHLAVSHGVRETVSASLREDVEVLVHGIDTRQVAHQRRRRDATRSMLGVARDEVLVITVANLRPEKGYPTLLRAAAHVLARDPRVRFVAVGQGPLEVSMRALHGELGLGPRFRFLGRRDDVAALLAGADLFALSSEHEGLPLAIMEAFAIGIPVVATDVGGVPEAVTTGVEGLLVPPKDPQALAAAITELVHDRSKRVEMGRAARRRSAEFDMTRAVRRIEQLYVSARPAEGGAR